MEINNIQISTKRELWWDCSVESVGGEVKDGEIDQVLKVRRDGSGEEIGREVKGLKIGAVSEERRNRASEGEVCEGELVDSAIVAGGSLEVGGEAITGVSEG